MAVPPRTHQSAARRDDTIAQNCLARRLHWLLDSWPGCYSTGVTFSIELEREEDGRWLAEVPSLPGVMCYGADRDEAVARVQALALRVIAERLEHREAPAEFLNVTFQAA
jgi:predicted RNase H-like HicB family nuclease